MKEYVIGKISAPPTENDWEKVPRAYMDNVPWKDFDIKFNNYACLLHDGEALYVKLVSDEFPVVARFTDSKSPVCLDSCMEFFFRPNRNSPCYINFEVNALGTLNLFWGNDTTERTRFVGDTDQFAINATILDKGWKVCYKIPFSFLDRIAGGVTAEMRGNFYKCGNETGHRHYNVWNQIENNEVSFHQPEYFGSLILEGTK